MPLACRYISRASPKDDNRHVVLGTQWYKPRDFALQMNVNLANGWGIVRTIVDLVMKQPDGKVSIDSFLRYKCKGETRVRAHRRFLSFPPVLSHPRPECSKNTRYSSFAAVEAKLTSFLPCLARPPSPSSVCIECHSMPSMQQRKERRIDLLRVKSQTEMDSSCRQAFFSLAFLPLLFPLLRSVLL